MSLLDKVKKIFSSEQVGEVTDIINPEIIKVVEPEPVEEVIPDINEPVKAIVKSMEEEDRWEYSFNNNGFGTLNFIAIDPVTELNLTFCIYNIKDSLKNFLDARNTWKEYYLSYISLTDVDSLSLSCFYPRWFTHDETYCLNNSFKKALYNRVETEISLSQANQENLNSEVDKKNLEERLDICEKYGVEYSK